MRSARRWGFWYHCVLVVFISACGATPAPGSGLRNTPDEGSESGGPGGDSTDSVSKKNQTRDPLKLSPNGKQFFDAGVMDGANGRLDEAARAFQKTIQTDPNAPQPYYNRGVVYERRGADLKALTYYRQSIQRKGDYLPALSAAAKLLVRYEKRDEAVQLVRTAAERYGSNVDIMVLYANILTMVQKYDDSIRVAKKALRIDERHAGAMLQIGKANLKMGRLELAESIFNQVLSINENIAEVHFLIGLLELKKGFRILAIKKFEKAVSLNPFYPEALNNLALEYMLAGNYNDAIQLFRRAIQITPSWGVLYLNYGNALRGAGKWKMALTALNRAGKMLPNSPAVIFDMAILYYTADNLNGLSRIARLKKSRSLFSEYKTRVGAALSQDDEVFKYIKELDLMIEREQIRVQRQKEAAEREQQRAAHKTTPEQNSGDAGAAGAEDESEGAADDGWE